MKHLRDRGETGTPLVTRHSRERLPHGRSHRRPDTEVGSASVPSASRRSHTSQCPHPPSVSCSSPKYRRMKSWRHATCLDVAHQVEEEAPLLLAVLWVVLSVAAVTDEASAQAEVRQSSVSSSPCAGCPSRPARPTSW